MITIKDVEITQKTLIEFQSVLLKLTNHSNMLACVDNGSYAPLGKKDFETLEQLNLLFDCINESLDTKE